MSPEPAYSRKNPFPAALQTNRLLTAAGSNKETRHIELSLAGSGLTYEVGDSLGVIASNSPDLVGMVLDAAGFCGDEPVTAPDGTEMSVRQALERHCHITEVSRSLLAAICERDPAAASFAALLETEKKAELESALRGRDVLDILSEFPAARFSPAELVKLLRKLQPRLYSISSSQKMVGEAVHLTVAVVSYGVAHSLRMREGVCSTYLARRAGVGVPVFVHSAKHFRLPENPSTPIVMVGPGTGVAPFRAFLQEREVTGTMGPAWLIFGEQHADTDFLYADEMERALKSGVLTKLTTAFSRDQPQKIYVQHRMAEHGAELFDWLQRGAFFYVCGDAARMAKDVDAALHAIVAQHGGLSPEAAREYVEALKKDKRYRKDIY